MNYKSTVIGFDDHIEELVLLDVKGLYFTCFASVCPYKVELFGCYEVQFYVNIFDDIRFEQLGDGVQESIQPIEGFRYLITGKLQDGVVFSNGIKFKEDSDFADLKHLEGHTLRINVDRLDVHFL